MKKQIFFMMLFALGLIYSCSDNQANIDADSQEVKVRNTDPDFISFNMPFPEGTQFKITGSAVSFTLPKTHYIVGVDSEGQYYQSLVGGTGSVTCECTQGSGCDPITSKVGSGCLMKDGCSKCTKTTASIQNVDAELIEIAIMNNEVNLFIDDFTQLNERYYLPKKFLEFEAINEILTNIQSEYLDNPNVETKTVFVDLLGYIVALDVPADSDNISLAIVGGGGDDISCSCNVSGSCPLEKHWTGTKWCNSDNCTKCTMSGVSIQMNGETKAFSITDGFIEFSI